MIGIGQDVLKIVGIALAYFLAHHVAFFFPDSGKVIMLIWPAGGIGLAAFLLNPRRLWPALILAFYISGISADVFLADRSFMTGVGYMTGNMIESIGCAWLILYWARDFRNFNQVKEILALIAGALFVIAISSCVGAGTSVLTRGASFIESWQSWYVAHGLGVLLVGPFIVTWFRIKKAIDGLDLKKIIEGLCFVTIWFLISLLIFGSIKTTFLFEFHVYVLVALLAWPALRFGQQGVTMALMLLFVTAIFSPVIVSGPSPWGGLDKDLAYRLLDLQLFLGFMSVVGYLLSAGYAERQRAEKALQESEERFRVITSNTPDHLIVHDRELRYSLVMNPQLGLTIEDMIGKTDYDFLSQDEAEKLTALKRQVLETGQPIRVEVPLTSIQREQEFFEGSYIPKFNKEGQVDGLIGYFRNVTERKRAEEQLSSVAQRLQLLMDVASDGIHIHDLEGNLVESGDSFCRMLGYTKEEIATLNVADWDARFNKEELLNQFQIQVKKSLIFETKHRRRDGTELDVEISSRGIQIDDKPYIYASSRDITERKEIEKKLNQAQHFVQQILDTTPNLIYIYDLINQKNIYANREVSSFLGYTAEEVQAMGSNLFPNILHPEDTALVAQHHAKFNYIGDGTVLEVEYRMKNFKGQWRWLRSRDILFTRDPQGLAWQILGFTEDITEGKQAEEMIRASLKEKEILLKEIHHRVKNNLTVIGSILSLQSQSLPDKATQAIFLECQNRVRSMSLIHTKLYQSKDLAHIDFGAYLRELTKELFQSYQVNPEEVILNIQAEDISPTINTAIPLSLILNELTTNALKYAFPEGRRGEIQITLIKEESQVILTVADNGIGFPDQIDFKNTKSLGLQLVMALVKQLHGTIEMEREQGTVFIIRLLG